MLLMHKNIPIAKVRIDNHIILGYDEIYNEKELPLGTRGNGKQQEQILLNQWYASRSIPGIRPNLRNIEEKIGIRKSDMFFYNSGISITDTYWFKEEDEEINWKDINYHDNGFDPVFASYYFNFDTNGKISPDYTTDGIMEKFWFMSGDKPYLAKIDTKNENTLSANEIVYFKAAAMAGITTTPYLYGTTKTKKFCICPCFINNSEEDYISAMQIKHNDFSLFGEMLIRFFIEKLNYEKEMKQMITLDCLFHNKDRHEKNFGIKRTKNGFEFIAPFDNGYCLGADKQIGAKITDSDMKIFNYSRHEILNRYGIELQIDRTAILNVLQDTYELFNISEQRYEIAKEELEYGFNLIKSAGKMKEYISKGISFTNDKINLSDIDVSDTSELERD